MPCNCKGRRGQDLPATIRSAGPRIGDAQLYNLATAPDCTERYHGAFPSTDLFVVALGTENETLFMRGRKVDAGTLARQNDWTLDRIPVANLCHEAVVAVLGG